MDFIKNPWSARNPLNIVALFITLIYGVAALLLGASINVLSPGNQTILVVFVVVFPVFTLVTFAWLVAKHHTKLYGPGDFRSDDGFRAAQVDPPGLGRRLADDLLIENAAGEGAGLAVDAPADDTSKKSLEPAISPRRAPKSETRAVVVEAQLANAYLVEGLVFQEIEIIYGTTIARNVGFSIGNNSIHVDGTFSIGNNSYIIEVKWLKNGSNVNASITRALNQLEKYDLSFKLNMSKPYQYVLAVAIDDQISEETVRRVFEMRMPTVQATLQVFKVGALLTKYGFSGHLVGPS